MFSNGETKYIPTWKGSMRENKNNFKNLKNAFLFHFSIKHVALESRK